MIYAGLFFLGMFVVAVIEGIWHTHRCQRERDEWHRAIDVRFPAPVTWRDKITLN